MSEPSIKVAVVEDSAEEREAIQTIIGRHTDLQCVGAFKSGEQALENIPRLAPDVILMDIGLPGISGIECIGRLKATHPRMQIMMLTVFEDHDRIFESLQAGASGYILKRQSSQLADLIRELHTGGAPMSGSIARQVVDWFQKRPAKDPHLEHLSKREEEILALLAKGFLYKEIAQRLGLGLGSVRTYIRRIYDKLHVRSRTEAVLKALPNGR